jgi:hypothetical protein
MKTLAAALLLLSCATTSQQAPEELASCPVEMTRAQHEAGVARCREMCASFARRYSEYDAMCRCRCAPAHDGIRAEAGESGQ